MATSEKTWSQLTADLEATFRKWHVGNWELASWFAAAKAVEKRKAGRLGQTLEQRSVTVRFDWYDRDARTYRTVVLTMNREETALANLELLAKAIEHMRMADMRGLTNLVVKLYRQMRPEQRKPPEQESHQEQSKERVRSRGPYAVLHVADDAPLEVAEAAYRALVRAAHPDVGGAHATMVALNVAIEQIRREHSARRR